METLYTKSEGYSLAYQILGREGPTLINIPGAISNLALDDSAFALAHYFERLSRFTRLVRWDRRGMGLSDRDTDPAPLDGQVVDLEAIRQAVRSETVALVGFSHGATLAALYAAKYPGRVTKLILIDGIVCDARDPRQPNGPENALSDWDAVCAAIDADYGAFAKAWSTVAGPDLDPLSAERIRQQVLASVSPAGMKSALRGIQGTDIRELLPDIRASTLVMHAVDDPVFPAAHGTHFAEHIKDARYVELASSFHAPQLDPAVAPIILTEIELFMTGKVEHTADRVLVTVLVTDIVDSTRKQQSMGDAAWRTLRHSFEGQSQALVERVGGRVVEFTGDGILAAFSTASEAVRSARSLVGAAHDLGAEIRGGLHTGEAYEVEGRLFGTCVTVAARAAGQSAPSQILATETVQDLVSGAGFSFEPAGEFELKGLGRRRLIALK